MSSYTGPSAASGAILGSSFCPFHSYHSGCALARALQSGLPGLPHVRHVWIPGFTRMKVGTNAPPLVPILQSKAFAAHET